MSVWINGEASETATVSVFDGGFVRGDGCFEALRSYSGQAFAIADHVDRLIVSANALDIDLPAADEIARWIDAAAVVADDGVVRVIATRGGPDPVSAPPVVVVMAEPLPPALTSSVKLLPMHAPWHSAGRPWQLAGAKTLSYGPNVNASRVARRDGFDDALLVSDDGTILEGPTFAVAWVVDGVIETPSLDLFILDSITRRYVFGLAGEVIEGRFSLTRLDSASEVFVMSTIKEVAPVTKIGQTSYPAGPVTERLAHDFRELLTNAGLSIPSRQ